MLNVPKDGISVQFDNRDDTYQSIVSDLTALIDHVHASMDLIESAISCEQPFGNQEIAANVIVLDDISPSYVRANTALNACSVNLSVALHFLKDVQISAQYREEFLIERPRARSSVRA